MADIIKHDFGKEDREHARRFARLMSLVEQQEEDLLANPGKYFALACDRLNEQEEFIRSLQEVIRSAWQIKPYDPKEPIQSLDLKTVIVDNRDYDAFQQIKQMLQSRAQS